MQDAGCEDVILMVKHQIASVVPVYGTGTNPMQNKAPNNYPNKYTNWSKRFPVLREKIIPIVSNIPRG